MCQSIKMPQFNPTFSDNVIAFTSDRAVDFAFQDGQFTLTSAQKEFLSSRLKCRLPEPVMIRQMHGDKIIVADNKFPQRGSALEEADGLITRVTRLPLTVRSADCLPVFLHDQAHDGIGLVHVGWKGSHQNILGKTIELMESQWQTDPSEVKVYFGPAIRSCCYEVGYEFKDYFFGEMIARDNRYFLDLAEINRSRLMHCGVNDADIDDCEICTCCDKNYFSLRREKELAGRMLSLIVINN